MLEKKYPHTPILLTEIASFFCDTSVHTFIDGTVGAGGHAEEILRQHPEIELFIGIDQDPQALEIARDRLADFGKKVHLVYANYRSMTEVCSQFGDIQADGILLDLGVSSMQLDQAARGMSFSKEGPLDMRMDPKGELTAMGILNSWSEEEIGKLLRDYGEEPRWRAAAKVIVESRKKIVFQTTFDLVKVLRPVLFCKSRKQINPMTLVFQALRIAVNDELGSLSEGINACIDLLAPEGKLGIISFHSLEDRIVKNAFREASGYRGGRDAHILIDANIESRVKILTKKPLTPSKEEQIANPRSRSAKLRFVGRE